MKTRTFNRGFAELVLIVIGVLIALAFEAWWSEREQSAAELAYLAEMREEFRGLASFADSVADRARESQADLARLDSVLDLPPENVHPDSVLELAEAVWLFQPFTPVVPVYEEFKVTIGLGELSDPALRRSFFELESELAVAEYLNRYLFDASVGIWEPILMSRIPEENASDAHRMLLPPIEELASDLELRNLVSERRSFEGTLLRTRLRMAEASRAIVQEIDRVLDGGR